MSQSDLETTIRALLQRCNSSPSVAKAALLELHTICRTSGEATLKLAEAGGVAAAHRVLASTDGAEALGLLWSLSACEGTLAMFTPEALWDVVRVGKSSQDVWRKTAALSTLHNLLCYEGHEKVLAAGSLDFAVDVLSSDAETGILSAAAKLLDQCCFDSRSKNTAVQRIPIAALTANMDRSLLLDPNLNNPAIVGNLEDFLSLLWNATDDVFFVDPAAWLRLTDRFCQPSLLAVLGQCLTASQTSLQQAAAATIHNFASNRALHDRLHKSGVVRSMPKLLEAGSDSAICCVLAVVELYGSQESGAECKVTELPTVVPSLIDELRRRINAEPASDKESTSMRMQELVGTRKLLSAIECLASSDRHLEQLEVHGAVGVLVTVMRDCRADTRGICHALDALMHILIWDSRAKRRIDFKDALMEFRRCAQDDDHRVRSAARGLIFALNHPAALGLEVFRPPQLKQGQVSVVLSFHNKDAGMAMRVRSGLAVAGTQVLQHDIIVDVGDTAQDLQVVMDHATVIVACMSRFYRSSARARLIGTVAAYAGVRVVPVELESIESPAEWVNGLRSRTSVDHVAASVPMMDMSASQISMLVSSVSSSRFAGSTSSAAPPLAPLDTGALGHASSPARPSGVSLNVQKVQANFATESDVSKIPIALKVPVPSSGELEQDTGESKPAYESDDDDDDQEESDQGQEGEEGEDDDDEVYDSKPWGRRASPSSLDDRGSQGVTTRSTVISQYLIEDLRYCAASWFSLETVAGAQRRRRLGKTMRAWEEALRARPTESTGQGRSKSSSAKTSVQMSREDVSAWLQECGLDSLCHIFSSNEVDGRSLKAMHSIGLENKTRLLSYLKGELGADHFGSALAVVHELDVLFSDDAHQ